MMRKIAIDLNIERVPLVSIGDSNKVTGDRYSSTSDFVDSGWHRHDVAKLAALESGSIGVRTDTESMVLSSGMVIYVPANLAHIEVVTVSP